MKQICDLEPGDQVIREFPASKDETGREIFPSARYEGRVAEVTKSTLKVLVEMDGARTFEFDRATGFDVNGPDFGRLVF